MTSGPADYRRDPSARGHRLAVQLTAAVHRPPGVTPRGKNGSPCRSIHSLPWPLRSRYRPGSMRCSSVPESLGLPRSRRAGRLSAACVLWAAAAAGEETKDDPIAWYAGATSTDPDYSNLLEGLAPTPADRRALLRLLCPHRGGAGPGCEASTRAHRAIARLAAAGYIGRRDNQLRSIVGGRSRRSGALIRKSSPGPAAVAVDPSPPRRRDRHQGPRRYLAPT